MAIKTNDHYHTKQGKHKIKLLYPVSAGFILHFPLHLCDPDQEAEGSPGTVFVWSPVSLSAVAPTPTGGLYPTAPAHVVVVAQQPAVCSVQCVAAAPAPNTRVLIA